MPQGQNSQHPLPAIYTKVPGSALLLPGAMAAPEDRHVRLQRICAAGSLSRIDRYAAGTAFVSHTPLTDQ